MARRKTAAAPDTKVKSTTVEGPCGSCGCPVVATRKRVVEGRLCCRSVACEARMLWSDDEWRARAHLAARRPPWRLRQQVSVPTTGWCECSGEPVRLASFVIGIDGDRVTLAPVCPLCRIMPLGRSTWVDDPAVFGGGDPHRWVDFEALRRFPDGADEPSWSLRPVDDGEVRRVHDAPAPVRADRPRAGDLALYRGELVPIQAVELPDGSVEVLQADGTVKMLPPQPFVAPAPVEVAAPAPAVAPIVPTPAAAPVNAVRVGPPVCLLAEGDPKRGVVSKCGREVKRKTGDRLADHRMTGWSSQVTCPACLAPARTAAA